MESYKIKLKIGNETYFTLTDILPENGSLEILFIAKTPTPISVEAGHYFQGKQGTMFWNRLSDYNILNVPKDDYADNYLLQNNYGITDIVKIPRDYGNEPSDIEYKHGLNRIMETIKKFKPKVIVFVYKKVLDNIMKISFGIKTKSNYGFNPHLDKHFNSRVFVFPMPGTPCRSEVAIDSMIRLQKLLKK